MDKATTNVEMSSTVVSNINNKNLLKQQIRQLEKDELIELFINRLKGPKVDKIPLSIFNKKLSALEVTVKYLKENLEFSNNKIALLLKRSPQNIWITYNNSKKKYSEKLIIRTSSHDLPLTIFENEKLSMFEIIVMHLKEDYTNNEIATILHRNIKTIVTIVGRAKLKSK